MAYEAREIKDRIASGDDCFYMEQLPDGRIKLTPAPNEVSEPGTDMNKALFQPMENNITWLMNHSTEVVTYVGDGDLKRTINIGYEPSCVIVIKTPASSGYSGTMFVSIKNKTFNTYFYGADLHASNTYLCTTTGFEVGLGDNIWQSSAPPSYRHGYTTNELGTEYTAICYR